MHTLTESVPLLNFYFNKPTIALENQSAVSSEHFQAIQHILKQQTPTQNWSDFLKVMKEKIKADAIPDKALYATLRILLTGSATGMQLHDLFECLGQQEFFERLQK